jgi:hypothetical protein
MLYPRDAPCIFFEAAPASSEGWASTIVHQHQIQSLTLNQQSEK